MKPEQLTSRVIEQLSLDTRDISQLCFQLEHNILSTITRDRYKKQISELVNSIANYDNIFNLEEPKKHNEELKVDWVVVKETKL